MRNAALLHAISLLVLVSCSKAPDNAEGPEDWPDIEAECADEWPSANCLSGCSGAIEGFWAEGYLDFLAEKWGLSRKVVDQHVKIRRSILTATRGDHVKLTVQIEVDWLVAVYEVRADLGSPPANSKQAKEAFSPAYQIPQIDVTQSPRRWNVVETFVADCEDSLEVTFDDWCRTYITQERDDDDQAGIRFDFSTFIGDNDMASASVYAWGNESDYCNVINASTER